MTVINVISDFPRANWGNFHQGSVDVERSHFIFSEWPVTADWFVIFDTPRRIEFPRPTKNVIFLPGEPPEIIEYCPQDLARVPILRAPYFPQFVEMRNWMPLEGYWPLHVRAGARLDRAQCETPQETCGPQKPPGKGGISMLISNKSQTPLQRWRKKLASALRKEVAEVDVFVGGVEDKACCLRPYAFHIAVENSVHTGYFTEKLMDPLVLGTHPIYAGSPQLPDDFEGIVTRIEPFDTVGAVQLIADLAAQQASPSYLSGVEEKMRRVASQYTIKARIAFAIKETLSQSELRPANAVEYVHVRRRRRRPGMRLRSLVSSYHTKRVPPG